jgi:hypothetical protein
MADEPQDTTAEGGEGTGPDVEQDVEGVAEVTDHSTKLDESEEADRVGFGVPKGVNPAKFKDRDSPPQL